MLFLLLSSLHADIVLVLNGMAICVHVSGTIETVRTVVILDAIVTVNVSFFVTTVFCVLITAYAVNVVDADVIVVGVAGVLIVVNHAVVFAVAVSVVVVNVIVGILSLMHFKALFQESLMNRR